MSDFWGYTQRDSSLDVTMTYERNPNSDEYGNISESVPGTKGKFTILGGFVAIPKTLLPIDGFPSTSHIIDNLADKVNLSWYNCLGNPFDYRSSLGDNPISFDWVYNYTREAFQDLEEGAGASCPDLLLREVAHPLRPNKFKIYKELEALYNQEQVS